VVLLSYMICRIGDVQVQEIEGELNSRKQEEAKRRRDVQEIREQITALELELNSLDETVDYQVRMVSLLKIPCAPCPEKNKPTVFCYVTLKVAYEFL